MKVYLQSSPVQRMLGKTIAYIERYDGRMDPLDYALSVRLRLLTVALAGSAQAIHCFVQWTFLSAASLMTIGLWRELELATHRAGAHCGAGLVGATIALSSLVYPESAHEMTLKIAYRADNEFRALCATISDDFDQDADALYLSRKELADQSKDVENPRFFNRAVKVMRNERMALIKECLRSYPSDPQSKYESICRSQARLLELLARQRKELKYLPCTQREADTFYIDQATAIADNALKDLYAEPLKVWAERINTWGKIGIERHLRKNVLNYPASIVGIKRSKRLLIT